MAEREEWLIEYVHVGRTLKVSAIDPETGKEAFVVGPDSAAKRDLATLAIQKLKKRISAKKDG